jgi:hypothetical protein
MRGASRPAGEDALLRPGQAGQALGSETPWPAGAVSVDGASSAVEHAPVTANAEWGVRRRDAGTDRRWSAERLPNL